MTILTRTVLLRRLYSGNSIPGSAIRTCHKMQVLSCETSGAGSPDDVAELAATRATIQAVSSNSSTGDDSRRVTSDGPPFAVFSQTTDPQEVTPSVRTYLKQLARVANNAAASLACGSILAGHTSEADEYGDVAVWLGPGDFGPGHERDALAALGLADKIPRDGRIREVQISPETGLPATVRLPSETTGSVIQLRELLGHLRQARVFTVDGSPMVLYLLLGRYSSEEQSGVAGLLGLGIET
ncbi:hypothetical protein C8Q77DRAFT_1115963 [Trametes polyzona]|nr:hypothetical protein C8Q77DRAFT_1115963 [Trametes polyzona]